MKVRPPLTTKNQRNKTQNPKFSQAGFRFFQTQFVPQFDDFPLVLGGAYMPPALAHSGLGGSYVPPVAAPMGAPPGASPGGGSYVWDTQTETGRSTVTLASSFKGKGGNYLELLTNGVSQPSNRYVHGIRKIKANGYMSINTIRKYFEGGSTG